MSEISKLNNYNIKDRIARANHATLVGEINGFVNEINAALEELENKISNGGYTLPIATSSALGGIKTGYTTSGKNYKVQVDSRGNAYVNVPWTDTNTDTNTTYTFAGGTNSFTVTPSGGTAQTVTVTPSIAAASTSVAGLMSSADKTKLDGIATGANAYSLPLAASGTRGGIQIGYSASGANIPLQLSSEKAYVALTSTAITSALSYTPIKASDLSGYATKSENTANLTEAKSYTDTKIAALINSSPATLDTLDELAAALGDDPNFATTVSTKIGNNTSAITALQTAVAGKLEKTTYEKSAELACGSNGKVCLGKFGAYDTNITIELNSTTNTTYHATIIIHSQNVVANGTGGTVGCYVYGDADNHVTPLISVFRPYGSASRQIEVYANLAGWSKNLVHVQAVALSDGGMTDVLTSVSEIPTAITGKTKVTPVNVLTTAFLGKTDKAASASVADSANAVAWANVSSKPSFATVATSGSYADLTNKPTIPTKTSQLTNDSGYIKSYTETDPTVPAWAKAASKPSYSYSEITGKPTLATVATSGSYNDLTNKPTIPTYTLGSFGITATATELNYVDGVTSNIQTQLNGKLSTDGGTISGDLTLYAASGDSPKLRLQRGDNTGTITDWNINVVSGALNFNTVSVSGSTTENTVASIGYNGQFNVNGSFMENSVALSDKYQAKGSYASPSDVSTALSTAKSYTDTAVAGLVDSSPETLNTLNELAAALGDDPNFATTIATQIGGKLSTSGGTITGDVTMSATSNANSANFAWGTVNSNTPYFGYASDQTDGTFVWSLKGTNYASGLAIGGGSGNLLWKGTRVATTADIPSVATASTAGLVKPVSVITKPTLNSVTTTAGKYYQVQMSNDGNMFVNVPWEAGSGGAGSLTDLGVTATAAELNYVDGVTSNIQTQLNGKLPVFTQSSYNANTSYDAGLYMVANGSNLPSGTPYGSLLTLPYRKGSGNTSPDFGTQIFIPNGDDATRPNSMFFRTSLSGQWNAWQEVAKKSDIPATYTLPVASSAALGGVKSGTDITVDSSGNVTVSKAAKVKSIDTTSSMATCRVALLLDAAGRDNDELIKTADLKYNVSKKSLIENGVALSDKYGTYTHNIELETQNGYLWITVVDNHATAYNDTTFREKYPNGFFQATGATWSWDGILVGQLDVGSGEFYGVVSYADGYTTPVMDSMTFTVTSDTVSN